MRSSPRSSWGAGSCCGRASGYGFTAEPDFLFVLDMKTGEVVEKTKVKSGPEVILDKSGELYVRTYDHDYVFGVR